ncbi:MAG: hypothetical protein ABIA63_09620, partial [bacterium]
MSIRVSSFHFYGLIFLFLFNSLCAEQWKYSTYRFKRGLLNTRYISGSYAQMRPGDDTVKDIDNMIAGYGPNINIPVDSNFNITFFGSQANLSGKLIDSGFSLHARGEWLTAGAGVVYHLIPEG